MTITLNGFTAIALDMSRLACLLIIALLSGSVSAQSFSTLEERMSGKEFRETGLEKLTPEELSALNAWLQAEIRGVVSSAVPPPPPDRTGFTNAPGNAFNSKVVGDFKGWDKGTRFTLENGQVWEVVDAVRFVANLTNPAVRIRPGAFGTWFFSVEGYHSQTRVKRIR